MIRSAVLAVLTALSITLMPHAGWAQTAGEIQTLRKDVDALKEGQTAIQKDLQEIKNLLKARPTVAAPPAAGGPPQEAVVGVEGAPFKGKKDAKVTLVDFTDYQ
jgi:hypothetical protein